MLTHIFWEFFHLEKKTRNFSEHVCQSENFPKIPKIIPKKSANQSKGENKSIFQTGKSHFADLDVLLRGATLNTLEKTLEQKL